MPPIVQYNILFSHNFGVVIVVMQVKTFARAYKKEGEARLKICPSYLHPPLLRLLCCRPMKSFQIKKWAPISLLKQLLMTGPQETNAKAKVRRPSTSTLKLVVHPSNHFNKTGGLNYPYKHVDYQTGDPSYLKTVHLEANLGGPSNIPTFDFGPWSFNPKNMVPLDLVHVSPKNSNTPPFNIWDYLEYFRTMTLMRPILVPRTLSIAVQGESEADQVIKRKKKGIAIRCSWAIQIQTPLMPRTKVRSREWWLKCCKIKILKFSQLLL